MSTPIIQEYIMSQTITLSFPLFVADAKPACSVANRKPAAVAAPVATGEKRVFTDSFAQTASTALHYIFFVAILTWHIAFIATVM
jgi:hypothetical protein